MRIKFLGVVISLIMLAGCATTLTPQQQAANALLAAQQTVITLAQEGDMACKVGILPVDKCMIMAETYMKARVAYDFAADQMLLAIDDNSGTVQETVLSAIRAAEKALTDFINLVTVYGLGGTK